MPGRVNGFMTDLSIAARPDMAPAFVARVLKRRCGGAHGPKDAEGIVDTMSKRLEGVRPATASDSATAAEGWRHMRDSFFLPRPASASLFIAGNLPARVSGQQCAIAGPVIRIPQAISTVQQSSIPATFASPVPAGDFAGHRHNLQL